MTRNVINLNAVKPMYYLMNFGTNEVILKSRDKDDLIQAMIERSTLGDCIINEERLREYVNMDKRRKRIIDQRIKSLQ